MTLDDTYITSGNLLTCCVYTLLDLADEDPYRKVSNGMEVKCRHGSRAHRMVLLNGVWRWIDPAEAEAQERDKLTRKKGGLLGRFRR